MYLLQQLEAAGKRSTPQRHAVCQALVAHGGHPTVAEIFERVRDIFPMISQATVYNTIDTLEELGLVQRVEIANHEHTHYDLNAGPHVNLVCTRCGHITDVHIEMLDNLLEQISERTGYQIRKSAGLVVYGTCQQPECQHPPLRDEAPQASYLGNGHNGAVRLNGNGNNGHSHNAKRNTATARNGQAASTRKRRSSVEV
ncbi:MAG: transcriptional repressor [Chloroflexaceae bacterium]|nr:transcriptional repressor [Chloroflexaceae bacterium]